MNKPVLIGGLLAFGACVFLIMYDPASEPFHKTKTSKGREHNNGQNPDEMGRITPNEHAPIPGTPEADAKIYVQKMLQAWKGVKEAEKPGQGHKKADATQAFLAIFNEGDKTNKALVPELENKILNGDFHRRFDGLLFYSCEKLLRSIDTPEARALLEKMQTPVGP